MRFAVLMGVVLFLGGMATFVPILYYFYNQNKEEINESLITSLSPEVQAQLDTQAALFRADLNEISQVNGSSANHILIEPETRFSGSVYVNESLYVNGALVLTEPLEAPNVLYSISAGDGLLVSGGQNPVITNLGVLSLQGETGEITFTSGSGITLDGTTISNTGVISLNGRTGSVSLVAGDNIAISGTTISAVLPEPIDPSVATGWENTGSAVYLASNTFNVGIGTQSPQSKLHVVGDTQIDGTLNVNGGITTNGIITLANLGAGIVKSDFSGVLTNGTVDLSSGSTDISGVLSILNGGTGISSYNAGDLLFASAEDTVSNLGVGAEGEVLIVQGGLPNWGSLTGPGGICATCVVTNPGSTQTITPTGANASGLVIASAPSGTADIFKITNNDGSSSYLTVDSNGSIILGESSFSTGTFTVSPPNSDPIAISPVAQGAGSFTGTITNLDLTADQTWTFPNESGVVCLASGNCSGTSASIGGSGTTNYVPKWSGTFGLQDSQIFDDGTNVGIGTNLPTSKLHVVGTANITGNSLVGGTLGVTGASTLGSTLSVTGATDLNSTLGVVGNGTFSNNLYVTGNVGVGTTSPTSKLMVVTNSGSIGLFVTQSGSGTSIQGNASSGIAVYGNSSGSIGVYGSGATSGVLGTSTNIGVQGQSTLGVPLESYLVNTSATNSVRTGLRIRHQITGAPSEGFGSQVLFQNSTTSSVAPVDSGAIGSIWTNPTHATRTSALTFSTINSASSLTEAMRISGNGNVGIGTTSPAEKLSVYSTAVGGELMRMYNNNSLGISFNNSGAGNNRVQMKGYNGSTLTTLIDPAGTTYFNGGGNVGIGDTSPASLLSVGNGDLFQVDASGNLIRVNNVPYSWPAAQGGAGTLLTNDGSGGLAWSTLGSASCPTCFLNGGNSFAGLATLGTNDANALAFETGGTERMRILSGGNVGIGTTTPGTLLTLSKAPITTIEGGAALDSTLLLRQNTDFGNAASAIEFGWGSGSNNYLGARIAAQTVGGGVQISISKQEQVPWGHILQNYLLQKRVMWVSAQQLQQQDWKYMVITII